VSWRKLIGIEDGLVQGIKLAQRPLFACTGATKKAAITAAFLVRLLCLTLGRFLPGCEAVCEGNFRSFAAISTEPVWRCSAISRPKG
jgi:hypothetical protein